MRLKSVTPKFVGPFMGTSTLTIEPDVTVITGANDTGKSMVLRAIEVLCSETTLKDHEVNRYKRSDFTGPCAEDPLIVTEAEFESTEYTQQIQKELAQNRREVPSGSIMKVTRRMFQTRGKIDLVTNPGGGTVQPGIGFTPPRLVSLPFSTEIRQLIDLGKPTEAERVFVSMAFGEGFNLNKHQGLDQFERSISVKAAEAKLQQILKKLFPNGSPFEFMLNEINAKPELLGVSLIDKYDSFAPLESRGSGIRRIVNILGVLMSVEPDLGPWIILYDEPEISLHANLQHVVRNFLESIASHPNVQVIYTTHSPSMINVMRPESIRVVERSNEGGKAVSKFNNNAYAENYVLVRSSLGISPADSLLYSPFTIIVEGSTEVVCLPLVLRKLATENGPIDSRILNRILPQVHILDGEGDKFEYMCRLAKSQGAKPIIFLDGDKSNKLSLVRSNHPEVPIVLLDAWQEFEDLVPLEVYVDAAALALDLSPDTANFNGYQEWLLTASLPERMLTSKKVQRWLDTVSQWGLNKTSAMRMAVEACDATQINTKPFLELFDHLLRVSGERKSPSVSS